MTDEELLKFYDNYNDFYINFFYYDIKATLSLRDLLRLVHLKNLSIEASNNHYPSYHITIPKNAAVVSVKNEEGRESDHNPGLATANNVTTESHLKKDEMIRELILNLKDIHNSILLVASLGLNRQPKLFKELVDEIFNMVEKNCDKAREYNINLDT